MSCNSLGWWLVFLSEAFQYLRLFIVNSLKVQLLNMILLHFGIALILCATVIGNVAPCVLA